MHLLISLATLAVIVGVIAWLASRGLCQHTGCTCRQPHPQHKGQEPPTTFHSH